ncbi:hypothetical protein Tco_1418256 [Tanacetum coccineum]
MILSQPSLHTFDDVPACDLYLSIGLRMVDRGKGLEYTEFLAKEWEYSFSELLPMIKDDYLGSSEPTYNVFTYKLLHVFSCYGHQRLSFDPFRKVVDIFKDQMSILAKDKGFGQEMHKSEESKAIYGVTSPRDYTVTSYNEEMIHHTLYGVKCLKDYAATFKITRDDVADSTLWRNIGDKGNVGSQRSYNRIISSEMVSFIVNMEDDVDINTLTIEQYLAWVQDDIRPGVVKPKIDNDVKFEINSNFIRSFPLQWRHSRCRYAYSVSYYTKRACLEMDSQTSSRKLEIIRNFKQKMDETLYHAWERYNDLLFKCPQHGLNYQQKVHIFYTRLDIPTRRVLDSKGFIPLMSPTQALISIQVMTEHSHNWYDEATTREQINDSPNNVDTKKPKENIHVIQSSFKNCEGAHLTMEYPLEKEDKAVEQSKYMRSLEETIFKFCNPYKTRKTICAIRILEEIKEDEGNMNDGCDITVEDVERLRKILTPPIHALPNLKPIVQPYMLLGLVYNKAKVIKEEEQDYDIPLHEHVMQPLTPQIVYITPPDDYYVASATNPILNKHLNEFEEEFADNTRVSEKYIVTMLTI